MLNVCRHRGTRLVNETQGTAKAFVCRYHAWTYDLEGHLGHVPLERCFPTLERDDAALTELPIESRHGFLWVLPTPRATLDVASWLGDVDDDLASFGLSDHVVLHRSTKVREAVALMDARGDVDFEYEGEMPPDLALEPELRGNYPFMRLTGPANVLIMPAIHSASISTKLVQGIGGATVLGPVLLGLSKPVQICPLSATVSQILTMATFAAHDVRTEPCVKAAAAE